jgi:N-carbamoyl-L-amino-acid hydrolase
MIETAADGRGLRSRRMVSGAGHDAKSMAQIVPSAMIHVPSVGGISHSPQERTLDRDIVTAANVLLDVAGRLAAAG